MSVYRYLEKREPIPDGSVKITCGIACEDKELWDVCANPNKVKELVELFNKEGLDPIHFPFVLEEKICE